MKFFTNFIYFFLKIVLSQSTEDMQIALVRGEAWWGQLLAQDAIYPQKAIFMIYYDVLDEHYHWILEFWVANTFFENFMQHKTYELNAQFFAGLTQNELKNLNLWVKCDMVWNPIDLILWFSC